MTPKGKYETFDCIRVKYKFRWKKRPPCTSVYLQKLLLFVTVVTDKKITNLPKLWFILKILYNFRSFRKNINYSKNILYTFLSPVNSITSKNYQTLEFEWQCVKLLLNSHVKHKNHARTIIMFASIAKRIWWYRWFYFPV